MKKRISSLIIMGLCVLNLLGTPVLADIQETKKDVTTIELGSYPQREITGEALTVEIKNAAYDESGLCRIDGIQYKRIPVVEKDSSVNGYYLQYWNWNEETGLYEAPSLNSEEPVLEEEQKSTEYRYFKCEPIVWNVLYEEKEQFLVIADKILDCKAYDDGRLVNWSILNPNKQEKSAVQEWLNTTFMDEAFSVKEKKAIIRNMDVRWEKEDSASLELSNNLEDYLFLPDITQAEELIAPLCTSGKIAFSATEYARAMGASDSILMLHSKCSFLESGKVSLYPIPPVIGIVYAYEQGVCPVMTVNVKEYYESGDVNYDGSITLEDAQSVLKASLGIIESAYNMDVNEDGVVNLVDAKTTLEKSLGIK